MKNSLLVFLMLLMLTPGLACAMPQCMHAAMQGSQKTSEMPCHGHEDQHGKKKADSGPMLLKDCSKADLSAATADTTLKKPDFKSDFFTPVFDIVKSYNFFSGFKQEIRGPPPEWPSASELQPAILLTTLRFRE